MAPSSTVASMSTGQPPTASKQDRARAAENPSRRGLGHEPSAHPLVTRVRGSLGLDPSRRYQVGLIRVSQKGNLDKLDDQRGTGVAVFKAMEDFAALKRLPMDVAAREWLAVRYRDLNPAGGSGIFGWVGLIGETLFVAVADSAVKANLPADPHDPAQIGRNAYVDLLISVALAGRARDIYVPFRSRWWRNDLYANQLMAAINRHLPGCRLWEGDRQVATSGAEKLVTDVIGRAEGSGNAEALAEQTFTKGIEHLEAGGQWDRRESELPLGLGRLRVLEAGGTTRKGLTVVENSFWAVAQEALAMRARGESWEEVGEHLARHAVPMTGTKARGRTFADYSKASERTSAARRLLLRHVDWYRTGEMIVRRHTKLERDEVRGHTLSFEPATGQRYRDVSVRLPWRPVLSESQWASFDRHEAEDAECRAARRQTGAATHEHSRRGAAFQGVPRWEGNQTLASETPSAYRWRRDGKIVATLRRTLVHRGAGIALLEALRHLDQTKVPATLRRGDGERLRDEEFRVVKMDEAIADLRARSEASDAELLRTRTQGKSEREIEHWRSQGEAIREELWRMEGDREIAKEDLALVRERVVDLIEEREADIAEPVLLASLLADGDQRVDPLVTEMCERYGITATLRVDWDDGGDEREGDQEAGRLARLHAVATITLLDGALAEVVMVWTVGDSHLAPGDASFAPAMLRQWAAGRDYGEIASRLPGYDSARVRRIVGRALREAGVVDRGLRRSLLEAPVVAPRAIVAAALLDDPGLASPYSATLREEISATYFGRGANFNGIWCDSANLAEHRRVLEVLADVNIGEEGVDLTALARSSGVARSVLYMMAVRNLVEKVSAHVVRARRCTYRDAALTSPCAGRMTVYTPAPEAGLICSKCWRPDGRAGQLGEEYTRHWIRDADGRLMVVSAPSVSTISRSRDRMLTVVEVARRLGVSTSAVRRLDVEGQLVPDSRDGVNRGRLYSVERINELDVEKIERWRTRFGAATEEGLLGTGDVATLLGVAPSIVRDFVEAGRLPVARVSEGGYLHFRRADVDEFDRGQLDAYFHQTISEAAAAVGLSVDTLRRLADQGKITSLRTVGRRRYFDVARLREELCVRGFSASEGRLAARIVVVPEA